MQCSRLFILQANQPITKEMGKNIYTDNKNIKYIKNIKY